MDLFSEIVVVSNESGKELFSTSLEKYKGSSPPTLSFAEPGKRRQDSLENGFLKMGEEPQFVCIHDTARPFVTKEMTLQILEAAKLGGAASSGVPLKFTIKECDREGNVIRTPDRSLFWEIQTPQILKFELLEQGLKFVKDHQMTVTDDVSIAELLNHPVKIVKGCYTNIKITTPDDLALANWIHAQYD